MLLSGMSTAQAGVTAVEAEALKGALTPLGAERAGNAEGTIPLLTGGYTTVPSGYRPGDVRPEPFADKKPILTIPAANYPAYVDKLPEGAKALFKAFPDYRMNIYPTHRTAAAPA